MLSGRSTEALTPGTTAIGSWKFGTSTGNEFSDAPRVLNILRLTCCYLVVDCVNNSATILCLRYIGLIYTNLELLGYIFSSGDNFMR